MRKRERLAWPELCGRRRTATVRDHYLGNGDIPHFAVTKKNACRPFRSCTRLSSKKSHEGGGEHSADDADKAIGVPTRKALSAHRNPRFGGPPTMKIPAWVQAGRFRFDPVQRRAATQSM